MISGETNFYFKEVETEEEFFKYFNIRYKVYCEEKKWLPADRYPNKIETDEYDKKAKHYIALDDDFNIVGCVRFLFGRDFRRLPYQDHPGVKKQDLDISMHVEISRLIITTNKNNATLLRGLLRVVYAVGKTYGAENWVMLAEPSLIRVVARVKHYFKPMCAPAKYFGSITYPAIYNLKENDELLQRKFPADYKYFNEDFRIVSIKEPKVTGELEPVI